MISYISKKVATASGDVRQAFEMLANAVQHRIQNPGTSDSNAVHIVKMPNVIVGNKETSNVRDKIRGQPLAGKVLMCVLTTLAQGGHTKATVGQLKMCVTDCMKRSGATDEILQLDDFLLLLETLVDTGLLRASDDANQDGSFNLTKLNLGDVHRQELHLGPPLEETEKALQTQLKEAYFQELRERASKNQDWF